MASVLSAIRNITGDSLWWLKCTFLSILVYIVAQTAVKQTYDSSSILIFFIVTLCIFMGTGAYIMNSVINNKVPTMPGLNGAFSMLKHCVLAPLTVMPGLILIYAIYTYMQDFILQLESPANYILYTIIILAVIPFIMIPLILYSARGNLFDSLRIQMVLRAAGNYIVEVLSFVVQLAFVCAIFAAFVYWFIRFMVGADNPFFILLFSIYATLLLIIFFSYNAELYGSVIQKIQDQQKPVFEEYKQEFEEYKKEIEAYKKHNK